MYVHISYELFDFPVMYLHQANDDAILPLNLLVFMQCDKNTFIWVCDTLVDQSYV